MAVITPLSRNQIEQFLAGYSLGELIELKPTLQGIENTSYFLTLQQPGNPSQHCVLTLFEELTEQQMPFFNRLLKHLAQHSLPVPAPIANKQGDLQASIQQKPTILFPRLSGAHPEKVGAEQCRQIGQFLGRMHRITRDSDEFRPNPNNFQWMQSAAEQLAPQLNSVDQQLLRSELEIYRSFRTEFGSLPKGIIHADLFRDNALYEGENLTGVIDFYNACNAPLLYDLAVVANDWCRSSGKPDLDLTASFQQAYQRERNLEPREKQAWPMMLRFAAYRFWISRLLGCYSAIPGKPTKDPLEFRQILIQRIESAGGLV